jgi:hypothetical protein
MRVAVNGEPVRPDRDQRIECMAKAGRRLPRQSVDQVDIYGTEPAPASGGDSVESLFDALDAIDGALYVPREVLDAETRPVESNLRKALDVARL